MSDIEPSFRDEVFGSYNRLMSHVKDLDDRGLVLSLSSFAEQALGDLISSFLIQGEPSRKLLEGFNAPLGTLSARIKSAYAFGLVTKRQYENLEILRKIRNEFAHSWELLSFDSPHISKLIVSIHYTQLTDMFPSSSREKLSTSLTALLLELRSTTNQIQKKKLHARLIGSELFPGGPGTMDEQMAECRKQIAKLASELQNASGEYKKYLITSRERLENTLSIVHSNAPTERKLEVKELQAEFRVRCY